MSERFPTSAVSHASLDSDLYKSPLTAKHVEDGLADSAAKYRINNERFSRSHEAMQEERVRRELGDGAIRAYNGTRYEAQYTRQAEEAEEQAIAEGAARAYAARQRGESVNPGQAFMRKLQENDMAEKVLEGAGSTTVLNGAFASEIAKVTSEETGSIDIDALNKNDLIRYRSSINHMVGEDAEAYDMRMRKVFGTSDYIDTVAKILEPGDLWTLQRIAQRNPGDNPLADALAKHFNDSEDLAA